MKDQLIAFAIQQAPGLLASLREAFQKQNPDAAPPTDAEIAVAYREAFQASIEKDDRWLAAHPETPADSKG